MHLLLIKLRTLFLTLICCSLSIYASSQPVYFGPITFDAGDTVAPSAIYIDTVNYHRNQWQIGKPQKTIFDSAASTPNVIVTDTINACFPNDTSVFILKMKNRYLYCWIGWVSFEYWLNISPGSSVHIDVNYGMDSSWDRLNSHFTHISHDTTYFDTSTAGWRRISLSPDYFNSDSMFLRFVFIADSSSTPFDGLMIDNIRITHMTEGGINNPFASPVHISPNPVKDLMSVSRTEAFSNIRVVNLLSQTVLEESGRAYQRQLNVSSLSPGVYIVLVDGIPSGRFVKSD